MHVSYSGLFLVCALKRILYNHHTSYNLASCLTLILPEDSRLPRDLTVPTSSKFHIFHTNILHSVFQLECCRHLGWNNSPQMCGTLGCLASLPSSTLSQQHSHYQKPLGRPHLQALPRRALLSPEENHWLPHVKVPKQW